MPVVQTDKYGQTDISMYQRASIEGVVQCGHLVQHAAQRPHVALVAVRLVLEDLGGHVVRRPDTRLREVHGAF